MSGGLICLGLAWAASLSMMKSQISWGSRMTIVADPPKEEAPDR